MKLRTRPKRKKDQVLDAVASAAKTWSEWHLMKRAGKSVAKPASSVAKRCKTKPIKIAGAVAIAGGVGAAVARKLKRGADAPPDYTPPAPPPPAPPRIVEPAADPLFPAAAPGAAPPPVQAVPSPDPPPEDLAEPEPVVEPPVPDFWARPADDAAATESDPAGSAPESTPSEAAPEAEPEDQASSEHEPGA